VIVRVPKASTPVVNVATPWVRVTVPRIAVPFLNVTLPGGDPDCDETVAVNVTGCPKVEGFSDEVRITALVAGLTT
jgi:copper(I)-binding protein